jgi:large subunit ribosomal protein L6
MSRVGKAPISIPEGIEIKIDGNKVSVKGKLGELSETVHSDLSVKIEDGVLTVEHRTKDKL